MSELLLKGVAYEITPLPDGGWMAQEPLSARIHRFSHDRVSQIAAGETPVSLLERPKVVLLVIPHRSLRTDLVVDLRPFARRQHDLKPLGSHGWKGRYNWDGFLAISPGPTPERAEGYLQLYRNGIIETVTTELTGIQNGQLFIASLLFEQELIESAHSGLLVSQALGIDPPYSVVVGLTGMKGALMAPDSSRHSFGQGHPIDRDILVTPPTDVASSDVEPAAFLAPIFERIWQAAGWPGSHYYKDGQRTR